MREFIRFGVDDFLLLTGHLSARIEASLSAIIAGLPRPVSVRCLREPEEAGTGGALYHAAPHLQPRFLLCNGDSWFDCNLADVLAAAADDAPSVIGRMVLRTVEDASRFGVVTLDGARIASFSERPAAGSFGIINGGVYVFDRRLLAHLQPRCSLERDVLPGLAAGGALSGSVAQGYFRDIGIPADFARAQTEIPARTQRRALFLDRDGVMNIDHGYVGSRDRFAWVTGAREAVALATRAGWHVFIVTNQSGVARGMYDEAAVTSLHAWMLGEVLRVGGTFDDMRFCPCHPEGSVAAYRRASDWRKPAPGMLLDLIRAWELRPFACAMIGDNGTDMEAAAAAGVAGRLFGGGDLRGLVADVLAT